MLNIFGYLSNWEMIMARRVRPKKIWSSGIWTLLCGRVVSKSHVPTPILTCLWTSANESPVNKWFVKPFIIKALFSSVYFISPFKSNTQNTIHNSFQHYTLHLNATFDMSIIYLFSLLSELFFSFLFAGLCNEEHSLRDGQFKENFVNFIHSSRQLR